MYICNVMNKFEHDKIVPYKSSTLSKKEQIADMFNSISKKYDFLNRFLSVGVDNYWRKKALNELRELHPKTILDVATGTADVAIMAERKLNPNKITGIDISEGMLDMGRKKISELHLNDKIELLLGDSEAIKYPDNTFDAVTVAFGVRNFQNLEKGLSEIKKSFET